MFESLKSGYVSVKESIVNIKLSFVKELHGFFHGHIDKSFIKHLENLLYSSDFSTDSVRHIIDRVECSLGGSATMDEVTSLCRKSIIEILTKDVKDRDVDFPKICLVVGLNGSGKTTSCGKLAHYYLSQGKSIALATCDRFRAAAKEQLEKTSKKYGIRFIDCDGTPNAVTYKAISRLKSDNLDCLILDSAGRLDSKESLMKELGKIFKTARKHHSNVEALYVIDILNGSSSIEQYQAFNHQADIDKFIATKLDTSSKGGLIPSLVSLSKKPVAFIGNGPSIDDFHLFDPKIFSESIL